MDEVWTRVDAELKRKNRNWSWLAKELGATDQAVHNWKARRVPPHSYQDIAYVLQRTVDWLIGTDPVGSSISHLRSPVAAEQSVAAWGDRWPFARVSLQRVLRLPAPEFERIHGYIEAIVQQWENNTGESPNAGRS